MLNIRNRLFKLSDKQYACFQAKLTPNINPKLFIGVRVPKVRELAKQIKNNPGVPLFLNQLPHLYYDENMLHGLLIAEINDYDLCLKEVNRFLPYIDNWAVCDIMSPKIFKKHKDKLIIQIKKWLKSSKTYTLRFALEMLMSHYLDIDFKKEYLALAANVKNEEYYVKMMVAWYFATALAKQYDATIVYLKNNYLSPWVHNKTIQKAIESYRIDNKTKIYLKTLKK